MRIQRHDDDDIRELLERGSSSWSGPSPRASQSRWAARAERSDRAGTLRAFAVGFALAVVAGVVVTAATDARSGAATTVMHAVSHVFPVSTELPGAPSSPAAPPSVSLPARTPGAAVPLGSPSATPRPTVRPSPSPTRRAWDDDR